MKILASACLVAVMLLVGASTAAAQFISETFRNNASSTLASDINNSTDSIPVQTGDGAKFPSSGFFFVTLSQSGTVEIVKCTGRSTDTLTGCTRAQQSTSAASFTTGANVYMGSVRGTFEGIQTALGATFIVQTATSELANEQALGALSTGLLKNTTTTGVLSIATAGTDYSSPSSADTLTNKTLDVEGTGNTVTVTQRIPYVVAVCQNGVASLGLSVGATAPSAACVTGTNTNLGVARFPDVDGNYDLQGFFPLPGDWTGNIDFAGVYRGSGTSGDVVWQLSTVCVADAETVDPAFNSAQDITDAQKGTTLQLNDFSQASVTTTGCAAGETFFWRLRRQRTHASDTATGTLDLISVSFTIRRAM